MPDAGAAPHVGRRRTRPGADGITAYVVERLGNQLFMYAAALAQARRLDCPLYGNLAYYRRRNARADRPYGLGSFDHGMIVDGSRAAHDLLWIGHPDVKVARPWYGVIRPKLRPGAGPVFVERTFRYDPAIHEISPGTTLLGFFQSWRYFASAADELRQRLSALTNPSPWFQRASEEINSPGSVVLNVRRGDYTNPAVRAVHGLATRAYYERALAVARRLGADGPVFVISDDTELAMAELRPLGDLTAVVPPAGTDPYEVMVAMSRAHALVMGNSTFSWWAGWLGDRPDRPVFAPRPWVAAQDGVERDLLPPHWLTLDARDLA